MRRQSIFYGILIWHQIAVAHAATPYALRLSDTSIAFDRMDGSRAYPVIKSMAYDANFMDGPAFHTVGIAGREGEGGFTRLQMAIEGPAARDATVAVEIRQHAMDVNMKWSIRYNGPAKDFNGWSTGFRLEYAQRVRDAHTAVVSKFVHPSGEKPYEVKGDTPYRDTECQLREVAFQDSHLVLATRWYDPDWIYGRNAQRAAFMSAGLPKTRPAEVTHEFSLFTFPPSAASMTRDPGTVADLAATAGGRPFSISVISGRVGNLFRPGETLSFNLRLRNVTAVPQQGALDWKVRDYYGTQLTGKRESLKAAPEEIRRISVSIPQARRGILFLDATLRTSAGEWIDRTTFGVLPERPVGNPKPESPFGLAGLIASPQFYPDQHPMEVVLPLAQRIGVRWLRGGVYPFKLNPTADEGQRAREQTALLAKCGLSLHAQIGSAVPKPEELADFKAKLRDTLSRFKGVTPYVEIGNELNSGTTAQDYVERMLRPIHDLMREAAPECKVMSMGLGGVNNAWLDAFGAAGGMELVDILSVHPGSQPRAPEFWQGWRGLVFRPQMLDALEAAKKAGGKEVWITEAYAPTSPGRSELDVRTAADYLVRTYAVSLALGVRVIEWYQFQDGVWFGQRPDPRDQEYNFGILYTDLTPKPGYIAYGVMTEQLEGSRYAGRLDLGAEDLYGVRFHRGSENLDVLWSYREKHEVDLPWWPPEKYKNDSRKPGEPWVERWHQPVTVTLQARGRVVITDIMGNSRQVETMNGTVVVNLTGSPVYTTGLGDIPLRKNLW